MLCIYYLALPLTEGQGVGGAGLSDPAVVVGPALFCGRADAASALVVAGAVVVLGALGHALLVDANLVGQAVPDRRARSCNKGEKVTLVHGRYGSFGTFCNEVLLVFKLTAADAEGANEVV